MSEMIRMGQPLFDRYEELLLRKNALQKECFHLDQEYIRVFGKDIMALYHAKLECIRKKKTIEFCQMARNRGEEPDAQALGDYVARETAEIQEHFQKIADEYEQAKDGKPVTDKEYAEIKKTYRQLAKLIHPDLHPEYEDAFLELWNQIVECYVCNDLEGLKEQEVLVAAALSGQAEIEVAVPDLEGKIAKLEADIADIMGKDPYQYKFLLEDPKAVDAKKASLREEIDNYRIYSQQLDEILSRVLPDGMIIFWE